MNESQPESVPLICLLNTVGNMINNLKIEARMSKDMHMKMILNYWLPGYKASTVTEEKMAKCKCFYIYLSESGFLSLTHFKRIHTHTYYCFIIVS